MQSILAKLCSSVRAPQHRALTVLGTTFSAPCDALLLLSLTLTLLLFPTAFTAGQSTLQTRLFLLWNKAHLICLWINRNMHIRKIWGGFYLQRIVPTIKSVFFMCNSKFGTLKFDVKTSWCRIHLDCSYCLRRAADVRRWIFILQVCLCT